MLVPFALLLFFGLAEARQLPMQAYTTAHGLPRSWILRIRADSRGFIWFCTPEGLSRFDGRRFVTYTQADGLPSARVNDLAITAAGTYWIASDSGLVRLQPQPSSPRLSVHADSGQLGPVTSLLSDSAGTLWIGSRNGLYRMRNADAASASPLEPVAAVKNAVTSLSEAPDHTIWSATVAGLFSIAPAGAIDSYTMKDGLPLNLVNAVLADAQGRLWAGTLQGLCMLPPPANGSRRRVERILTHRDGLAGIRISDIFQRSDGHLWVSAPAGITELIPAANGGFEARTYPTTLSLNDHVVESIAEDIDHNLWLATRDGGARKILRNGFETYTESDGLPSTSIYSIFEDRARILHVVSGRDQDISRFQAGAFVTTRPNYGFRTGNRGFRRGQIALQDRDGQWWIATSGGAVRFPRTTATEDLQTRAPATVYGPKDGLVTPNIYRIFEDSTGAIWIAAARPAGPPHGLSRWERSAGALHHFPQPDFARAAVTGFAQSAQGDLWISSFDGLHRYRGGQFEQLGPQKGFPTLIRCLLVDRAGRLWFGSAANGLGRIDNPAADQPQVRFYSTREGLSSIQVESLVEDLYGRIYAGSDHGVDRLDPASGVIRHYGPADGLTAGLIRVSHRDRSGHLWFGSADGLSEFVPQPDQPAPSPQTVISVIRVQGKALALSDFGEVSVPRLTLQPADNQLEIRFSALGRGAAQPLEYQYRINPLNTWSAASSEQSVNYASLSPGAYHFEARAVNAGGSVSALPAIVDFVVLAPIWQRAWFIALSASLLATIVYALHRWRLARVVELERVRTRIATDLHDDIGSSLTQIAILTELVQRKNQSGALDVPQVLSEIGDNARELVDSMSDIVWAIDPGHDHIRDLVYRMRRFAEDSCGARDIPLSFCAPESTTDVAGAHLRRQVFLIFKEALHNALRHSGCTAIEIAFTTSSVQLSLTIADNGRGFKPEASYEGQGLRSIRDRAHRLNGFVQWRTSAQGTSVELQAPLGRGRAHTASPHEHAVAVRAPFP